MTDECLGAVWLMHLLARTAPAARSATGPTRRHAAAASCPRRCGWPCATPSCRSPTAAWADAGCGSTSPTATSPSQRVALRGGFVEVGRDRLAERLGDGSYVDLVRYDLLESEYAAC